MAGEMGWMNRLWRPSGARPSTPATTGSVAASRDESPEAQSSIEEEVHREPNLGIQAKEDPADPLLNALDDSDPWVRLSAIEAMGARRDPRDTSLLLQALKDPSSSVRVYAIIALADRLSPNMREQLLEAANDSESVVRSRAIEAIAMLDDRHNTPRPLGSLKDPASHWQAWSGGEEASFTSKRGPDLAIGVGFGYQTSTVRVPAWSGRSRRGKRHASASSHDCWIPDGTEVDVARRTLRGLVYVGKDLGPVAAHPWLEIEPALIDPSLPVAVTGAQSPPRHVWPIAYEKLTPSERAEYLDWLAGGRVRPKR